VEKGKPRLRVTPEATFADLIKRLMPIFGNKVFNTAVIRGLGEQSMREKRRLQWQETMVDGDSDT